VLGGERAPRGEQPLAAHPDALRAHRRGEAARALQRDEAARDARRLARRDRPRRRLPRLAHARALRPSAAVISAVPCAASAVNGRPARRAGARSRRVRPGFRHSFAACFGRRTERALPHFLFWTVRWNWQPSVSKSEMTVEFEVTAKREPSGEKHAPEVEVAADHRVPQKMNGLWSVYVSFLATVFCVLHRLRF
jgi:hypothetical protein